MNIKLFLIVYLEQVALEGLLRIGLRLVGINKISNGIIIQWGRVDGQITQTSNVKYPISFSTLPKVSYNKETIGSTTTSINCDYIIEKLNIIGFVVHQSLMHSFSWIAIGY